MAFFGVFVLLALTLGYAGLRAYLHSEGFRKFLSAEVSKAAQVVGSFTAFKWDGLAVETEQFEAKGEGMIASVRADQIGTEVGFGALGKGAWELKQTRVSRVEVGLDFTKKNEPSPTLPDEVAKKVEKKQPGWVPSEVELESLAIGEQAIRAKTIEGEVAARGIKVRLEAASGKGAYEGEITGGTIAPAKDWLPEIRLEKVRGSFRNGSAYITSANIKAWDSGRIYGFGEWNSDTGTYALEGDLEGVKCDVVIANPPYIPDGQELPVDVREHEPAIALFGGADGMKAPRLFIAAAARLLKPGGFLALEHHEDQGLEIAAVLGVDFEDIVLHQDLTGRPRFTTAVRR
jgi:hypothetical protein